MSTPIGSGITNTTPNSLQTLVVPDTANNGYYYNKNTGKFEGNLTTKTGDVNDVYACTGKTGDGENSTFSGAVKLNITHVHFQTAANIVCQEAGTDEENECIYIAFASSNGAIKRGQDLYTWLMSARPNNSCVPQVQKTPMSDSHITSKYCNARKGVIMVFLGLSDMTDGATLWDGSDLLAWGDDQNKFREYSLITIKKSIYDVFLAKNVDKYPHGISYNIAGHRGHYPMPAPVFQDAHNFNAAGDFLYPTGVTHQPKIRATATAGRTVFWKVEH